MALNSVQKAVLDKAEAEAKRVGDKAREAADAWLQAESARLREAHASRIEEMKVELRGEIERDLGNRRMQDRLKVLQEKNDIIDSVFAKAVDRIRGLPDDGYAKWLAAQIACIPDGMAGQVLARTEDRELVAKLLKKAAPPNVKLTIAERDAVIVGGILVEGENVDLDFSVEALLDAQRERMTTLIASQLFSDDLRLPAVEGMLKDLDAALKTVAPPSELKEDKPVDEGKAPA